MVPIPAFTSQSQHTNRREVSSTIQNIIIRCFKCEKSKCYFFGIEDTD